MNLPALERRLALVRRRIDREWLKWGEIAYFINAERRIREVGPPYGWRYFVESAPTPGVGLQSRMVGALRIWRGFGQFVLVPPNEERRRLLYELPWHVLNVVAPYVYLETVDLILEKVQGMEFEQAEQFCKELLHIHELPDRMRVRERQTKLTIDAGQKSIAQMRELLEGLRGETTSDDKALELLLEAARRGLP